MVVFSNTPIPSTVSTSSLPSIDHIPPINHHRRPLHKRRLGTTQKQHAIGHLLRRPRTVHRRDGHGGPQHVHQGPRHGRVDDAGADAVDADAGGGVLGKMSVELEERRVGQEEEGGWERGRTSMASQRVMLMTAALLPQ